MITPDSNKEYLYSSRIAVKPTFFNYYDKTDPEIKVEKLNIAPAKVSLVIISKVFGDKYSARNWVFKIIKTAFLNGATIDEMNPLVMHLPFSCYGHQIDKITAIQSWNRFPDLNIDSPFCLGDVDFEFAIMSHNIVIKKPSQYEDRFQLDNLLDANTYRYNEIVKDQNTLETKGPEEPPFKLDFEKDLSQLEANIQNLTTDAVNYREYTIPPNSTVDLKSTSYNYVEIIEERDSVVFIFRNDRDYFTLGFDIKNGVWVDNQVVLNSEKGPIASGQLNLHKTSVKYLAAIILHDFWVPSYKERNKAYNPDRIRPRLSKYPWGKTDLDGRTNIYLPRIKYFSTEKNQIMMIADENIESVKDGIFQMRNYGRSAHIRNLMQTKMTPNADQVLLASEYNIQVPEGHTFVRPSNSINEEKAKAEIKSKNQFFISRTAINSLCNISHYNKSNANIKWQKFEYDALQYCKSYLKLTPLPRKIRKRGDGGIDILCMQKLKNKVYYWAIQCKCWSTNRIIGLPILRELYTAGLWMDELNEQQKKNLRYMLITTSDFSSDEEFIRSTNINNVVLINGETFAKKIIPENFC
jgi:hypothetical protein